MLTDGIYEQIINERIGAELLSMSDEFLIEKESLNADDSRHLLTIYLSHVIERGLHYIRDSFKSGAEEERKAILAEIRLSNDIIREVAEHIHAIDSSGEALDLQDEKILEQGEILTSIFQKLNSASSITKNKIIRPETSVLENALFTGAPSEPSLLSELKKEIRTADRIDLLVSFIKWSAIRQLMEDLRAFTERLDFQNTTGQPRLRIISTTYTRATDYKAIYELAKLPNTEIKINYETEHARLHAKSYFFHRDTNFSTAYIGSSNLSHAALTDGLEWNVKVTEQESFDILHKFEVAFESYWNNSSFKTFDADDPACREALYDALHVEKENPLQNFHLETGIRPYAYQQEILDQLEAERENDQHYKNLIVAATGVGKTVIAAFDYRRFKQTHKHARLLFVAHREEILEQSLRKFQEILNDFNFGDLYVGEYKPKSLEHLFISIQSFNATDLISKTSKDFYDYIIIDEFHHAAAPSYQKLLAYYQPTILLGLTATPERMDGKDVLRYFDGRISSKMLLSEAIDRNLLSPFQYFGITDSVNYAGMHWTKGRYDIHDLENAYIRTADTHRADLILKSVNRYVTDIHCVKGLGFCVSIAHANYMAEYFSNHQVPSVALSSESKKNVREQAKKDLIQGKINFIFVVDLYNEGVDIKPVDTILFLRPTESATVFVQQLGRGLRLCDGKECLTVLDFIGQANKHYRYRLKFQALLGNRRYRLSDQVEKGFSDLPRGCYIQLERKAKDYILENLNQTNNQTNQMIEQIRTFTEDTGKDLTLSNFLTEYGLTLYQFYKAGGARSMYRLMMKASEQQNFQDVNDKVYQRLTGLFHVNDKKLLDFWIHYIEEDASPSDEEERLMRNMLYYTFYQKCPEKEGYGSIDEGIQKELEMDFVRKEALDILKYKRNHLNFAGKPNEYPFTCPLEVNCEYNRGQIMAAFDFYNETASPEFREGVKYFEDKKTDIFLINLNKSEKEFSPSTMYDDFAISETLFQWQSQSQDREASSKIQRYIHHKSTDNQISLFAREFKHLASDHTYTAPYVFLGNADYVSHKGSQPVTFIWRLHVPIRSDFLVKANKTIAI